MTVQLLHGGRADERRMATPATSVGRAAAGSRAAAAAAPLADEVAGWATRGRCVGRDPDELFVTGAAQRSAARVCNGCPVRLECLSDALDNRMEYGVWGGLTERQRRGLLKQRPDVTNWRELLQTKTDVRAAG